MFIVTFVVAFGFYESDEPDIYVWPEGEAEDLQLTG